MLDTFEAVVPARQDAVVRKGLANVDTRAGQALRDQLGERNKIPAITITITTTTTPPRTSQRRAVHQKLRYGVPAQPKVDVIPVRELKDVRGDLLRERLVERRARHGAKVLLGVRRDLQFTEFKVRRIDVRGIDVGGKHRAVALGLFAKGERRPDLRPGLLYGLQQFPGQHVAPQL